MDEAEDRLFATPAETAASIAVKLRHLFLKIEEGKAASDLVMKGIAPSPEVFDWRFTMFWKVIGEVERIARRDGVAMKPTNQFDPQVQELVDRAHECATLTLQKKIIEQQ
jgi:hypothetical protein